MTGEKLYLNHMALFRTKIFEFFVNIKIRQIVAGRIPIDE